MTGVRPERRLRRGLVPEALLLSAWTLLVWTTRIGNIWADDSLTTADQLWRTALALIFTVFAGVTIAGWVRARRVAAPVSPFLATWIRIFAVWTIGVWAVRAVQIGGADHEIGFKVVHTVLAIVSVALALWADRAARRASQPASIDA